MVAHVHAVRGFLVTSRSDQPLTPGMTALYRWSSVLWVLAASSLGFYAHGSSLLNDAPQLRLVVPILAAAVALVMLARLFVPARARWGRWTLPLMGALSLCTCLLSLFGAQGLGYTPARVGVVGMTLTLALFAYTHWIGEALVTTPKGVRS